MKRKGSAEWQGGLKDGKGTVSTESGALANAQYGFSTRFENGPGTNPEELVAAAHAGCFSMAFSAELGRAGMTPTSVKTSATMNFEKLEAGWTGTAIHLECSVQVPGADVEKVKACAAAAKAGCPISRLLKTEITLETHVEV